MPLAASSSDVALVLVELGAIVFGLAIIARVSDRVGFSPIPFYLIAGLLYLAISTISGVLMRQAERYFNRGVRRA